MRKILLPILCCALVAWWALLQLSGKGPPRDRFAPSVYELESGLEASRIELRLLEQNREAFERIETLRMLEMSIAETQHEARILAVLEIDRRVYQLTEEIQKYEHDISLR